MPKGNKYIKIFGVEMSGTGFLEFILRNHLEARILMDSFGWRHGLPMDGQAYLDSPDCPSSMRKEMEEVVRNGKIDYIIIIRNPYEWYFPAKKNYREWDIHRAYHKYNRLYLNYKGFIENDINPLFREGMVIKFEDIRFEAMWLIDMLSEKWGLKKLEYKRAIRYPTTTHIPDIPEEELSIINKLVSDEVFKFYGYEKK